MILPPPINDIAKITQETLFENHLYLVGGSVRDHLLGLAFKNDFDLVTPLDAIKLAFLLHEKGGSTPVIYPRFGTASLQWKDHKIELVTARKEIYNIHSRKPQVEASSLFEDALRRDFTVNTLLYNIHQNRLVDPLKRGLKDLEARILKTPLDPFDTFHEDPLRMLRAVRFRWQLGFEPDLELYPAIFQQRKRLDMISKERIRDELEKMILADSASNALEDLEKLGLIEIFAPELSSLKGVTQGDQHHLDVWGHTLETLNHLKGKNLVTKLAGLLHDVGKSDCRSVVEGRIRFLNHEKIGEEKASQFLLRMRFSNDLSAQVSDLVRGHMRIGQHKEYTASTVRKLIRDFGENLKHLLSLTCADSLAHAPGFNEFDPVPFTKRWKEILEESEFLSFKSPLDGNELCKFFQLSPGPWIGLIKNYLMEQIIEGKLSSEDKSAAFLLAQSFRNENIHLFY